MDFNGLNIGLLKAVYENKGYKFFDSDLPYNLNIFGIRSMTIEANKFDDFIGCGFRNSQLEWILKIWEATTDPGSYWLNNPMNVNGTAILVPDQYRSAWKLGLHRGKYLALIQKKPVRVYRDTNLDDIIDQDVESSQAGIFGINIHRASEVGESQAVNKWSAGCQVFQSPDDFHEFMTLCERQKDLYGDSFTYTLFEHIDFMEV